MQDRRSLYLSDPNYGNLIGVAATQSLALTGSPSTSCALCTLSTPLLSLVSWHFGSNSAALGPSGSGTMM